MSYVASTYAELSDVVEGVGEAAVVFDPFGEILLHNRVAERFAGGRRAGGGDELSRALEGETVHGAMIDITITGRADPVPFVADLHPVLGPAGRTLAVLAVLRPSVARSRAALRRAAQNFLAAARHDETSGAIVFDSELRVVASTGHVTSDPLPYCVRALEGEVCRDPGCDDCQLRGGPIRDSLGFIVGGVVVAYGR